MEDIPKRAKNLNAGHRQRLRTRFKSSGIDSFQDYEVIELLLLYVARQKDMKPVAKALIEKFRSFQGVLDAPEEELLSIDGVGESAVTLIQFVKNAASRYLTQSSLQKITPDDISLVIDACRVKMGSLTNEQFRLISLNASFVVVGEDVIADGTVDQAVVYPRKIVEKALKHGATTIIFAHNHPSGDCLPSEMDKTITRSLSLAAKAVGLVVYDHVIVAAGGYYSFRENGLL